MATPEAIRDRCIALIKALTPAADTGVRFDPYRNEGDGDFQGWAEANPASCLRRFQVRTSGASWVPEVSNMDTEEHRLTLTVLVAYPHSHRWGTDNALDRDDVMDQDAFAIDELIGMLGGANFTGSHDCCWLEGAVPEIVRGSAVDFVSLSYTYNYSRTR